VRCNGCAASKTTFTSSEFEVLIQKARKDVQNAYRAHQSAKEKLRLAMIRKITLEKTFTLLKKQ